MYTASLQFAGRLSVILTLIKAGANVNAGHRYGSTLVNIANASQLDDAAAIFKLAGSRGRCKLPSFQKRPRL